MRINVHEATVMTATVQVKCLTINGRKVTLALFRQLIDEPLVTEDGVTLLGVPWGKVNYHPDGCGGDEAYRHIHVVWQKGDELRRAYVERPVNRPLFSAWAPKCLVAAVLGGWRPKDLHSGMAELKVPNGRCSISIPVSVKKLLSAEAGMAEFERWHSKRDDEWAQERREEYQQEIYVAQAALATEFEQIAKSGLELKALVVADFDKELRRREQAADLWRTLNDLTHLFIAG
jgi:hypothetical protein